jgi:hypothetical protein
MKEEVDVLLQNRRLLLKMELKRYPTLRSVISYYQGITRNTRRLRMSLRWRTKNPAMK